MSPEGRFDGKFNLCCGSAPNPAVGAYDAPPHLLVGWEGDTPPRLFPLNAFGASLACQSSLTFFPRFKLMSVIADVAYDRHMMLVPSAFLVHF